MFRDNVVGGRGNCIAAAERTVNVLVATGVSVTAVTVAFQFYAGVPWDQAMLNDWEVSCINDGSHGARKLCSLLRVPNAAPQPHYTRLLRALFRMCFFSLGRM